MPAQLPLALAHAFHLPARHNPVLDVVGLARQARFPPGVHILAIIGVNASQERFVGQRGPLGQAKDAVILVGPCQDVPAEIPSRQLPIWPTA